MGSHGRKSNKNTSSSNRYFASVANVFVCHIVRRVEQVGNNLRSVHLLASLLPLLLLDSTI